MMHSLIRTDLMFTFLNTGSIAFAGEIAALSAAFLWAFSSFLFSRLGSTIPPIEMNFLKGILAIVLFTATMWIMGDRIANMSLQTLVVLAISGAIGIGFGDTMYFEALNLLGPRRTLLVTTLAPVITAILAWGLLGESLSLLAILGIFITIGGIVWVITEQKQNTNPDTPKSSNHITRGIFFAFLAALTQAIGAVLSRWVLTGTQTSALQSALVRLVAGVLFVTLWVVVKRIKVGQWVKSKSTPRLWGTVAVVVLLGTYLAIWLQQVAFQFTHVGIAQTLLATSPLFVLPIAAIRGERLSLRSVFGVIAAIAGIALMFLPG